MLIWPHSQLWSEEGASGDVSDFTRKKKIIATKLSAMFCLSTNVWNQSPRCSCELPENITLLNSPCHREYKVPEKLFFPRRLWWNIGFSCTTLQQWQEQHEIGSTQGEVDRYIDPSRKHWLQVPVGESRHYRQEHPPPPLCHSSSVIWKTAERFVIKHGGTIYNHRFALPDTCMWNIVTLLK